MKELSKIASRVPPSATLAVNSLAKQMIAEGHNVIGFGAGEPDFNTPENIRAAAIDAINAGKTRYTPAAGMKELRVAAAEKLKADYDLDYDFKQIVIASGAKHIIYASLRTVVNPGDEIIVLAPYWVSYIEMVNIVGATPVVINASEAQNFKVTREQLENAVSDKTKAIMLNNPSNPTGMLYTREELEDIADFCKEHDLYVLADEIYDKLVYDNKTFTSFATLSEDAYNRTILINGVSKTYAMTGWRIGYSASSLEIAKIMGNYLSHSTGAPGMMNQVAAIEALSGPQEQIEAMRKEFEKRRNFVVERLNSIDGVSCIVPDGAFYVMMNLENIIGKTCGGKLIENDDNFAVTLLEKAKVAVVPCSSFGAPGFVRLTYTSSLENIAEGLDRLEKFLSE